MPGDGETEKRVAGKGQAMNLAHANYYTLEADREFMSVSQYRKWLSCPAAEAARQRGEWEPEDKIYFAVGKYVDCALTTPELFDAHCAEHYAEMMLKSGKDKKAEFRQADEMIARFRRDRVLCALFTGGESQVIIAGELNGVPWKAMLDYLVLDQSRFVDLKTTASFEDGWAKKSVEGLERNVRVPWYEAEPHNYWFQMASYQKLVHQKFGRYCLPIIAGVTKQTPPNIDAWYFGAQDVLDTYLSVFLADLGQVQAMKRGEAPLRACGACEYCRATKRPRLLPAESRLVRGAWQGPGDVIEMAAQEQETVALAE